MGDQNLKTKADSLNNQNLDWHSVMQLDSVKD